MKLRNLLMQIAVLFALTLLLAAPNLHAQAWQSTSNYLTLPFTTVTAGAQSNVLLNVAAGGYTAGSTFIRKNPGAPLTIQASFTCATNAIIQTGLYYQLSADGINFTTTSGGGLWQIIPAGSSGTNIVAITNVPASAIPAGVRAIRFGAGTNGSAANLTGLSVLLYEPK